jgi:hypothetical protein
MRALRTVIAVSMIVSLAAPAAAQDAPDLRKRAGHALAADDAAQPKRETVPAPPKNAVFWTGTGMFVGGMAVGLFGFINDKNGKFAEPGEATSSNKHLGAAGLGVAFAGGAMMFLGSRQGKLRHAPSVAFGPHAVAVSKHVSW